MATAKPPPQLTSGERAELERRARETTSSGRVRHRAQIVLLWAEGLTQREIEERVGVTLVTVNKWVQRFEKERLPGLKERARGWTRNRLARGKPPWLKAV